MHIHIGLYLEHQSQAQNALHTKMCASLNTLLCAENQMNAFNNCSCMYLRVDCRFMRKSESEANLFSMTTNNR